MAQLVVKLLYGSGLRITEAVRLRVQDVDYEYKQITVRSGKGDKDRITTFSTAMMPLLQNHLEKVKAIHVQDLADGFGAVYLPYALAKKYPNAERGWGWQYVFPVRSLSVDPLSGVTRRHHIDQSLINRNTGVRSCNKAFLSEQSIIDLCANIRIIYPKTSNISCIV